MSSPVLTKMHVNGYELVNVQGSQWTVCTATNRLGAFSSKEEASAYAFALPPHRPIASRKTPRK
jgi:hypothetical protein